jgi:hypothetical protein
MMDRNEIARRAFQAGAKMNGNRIVVPGHEGGGQRPVRVGVVVPSQDMWHANMAMAFASLMYSMGSASAQGAQFALFNTKGSNVAVNRNNGVELCKAHQCDFCFMVDTDLTFPALSILRLMSHGKDIVGASYARRIVPHVNQAQPLGNEATIVTDELVEVGGLPGGHMLIAMRVFEGMKRPYFRFPTIEEGEPIPEVYKTCAVDDGLPKILGEDYTFCHRAREAGFSSWLDVPLSYELAHWGEVGYKLRNVPKEEDGPNAQQFEVIELGAAA